MQKLVQALFAEWILRGKLMCLPVSLFQAVELKLFRLDGDSPGEKLPWDGNFNHVLK